MKKLLSTLLITAALFTARAQDRFLKLSDIPTNVIGGSYLQTHTWDSIHMLNTYTNNITINSSNWRVNNLGIQTTLPGGNNWYVPVYNVGGGTLLKFTAIDTFKRYFQTGLVSKTPLYGIIFNQSSFSNLTGFTNNGAQVSVASGQISLADSTNSNGYLNSLDITGGTFLNKWMMTVDFIAPSTLTSTTSFAIGTRSTNIYGSFIDVIGDIDLTNTASAGTLIIKGGVSGATILATAANKLTFAAGDHLQIYISRNNNTKTVRIVDVTTPTTDVSVTFSALGVLNTAAADIVNLQNRGRFSLFGKSSTALKVTGIKVVSTDQIGADVILVGDSQTGGVVDNYYSLFSSLLSQNYSVINCGGNGEITADFLLDEPEKLALKPKCIIYMGGGNDILQSIPIATTEANMTTFFNNAAAAGIPVYFLTGIWNANFDVSALATWIRANYPNNYIETFIPTQNNLSAFSNSINHPTDIGHILVYNAIINSGFLPGGRSKSIMSQEDFNNAYNFSFSVPTAGITLTLPNASGTLVKSVTTNNGVSASNTNGNLAFTLGAITPTSVNGIVFRGAGQTTLSSGTKAVSVTGVTTSSQAFVTLVTPNTASSTIQYKAVCTSGTVTITALVAAGTTNASDVSVVNYFVVN